MTAALPIGYVTILKAAEMRQPAMYAGVPDLPIVTKVRPWLETRLSRVPGNIVPAVVAVLSMDLKKAWRRTDGAHVMRAS